MSPLKEFKGSGKINQVPYTLNKIGPKQGKPRHGKQDDESQRRRVDLLETMSREEYLALVERSLKNLEEDKP